MKYKLVKLNKLSGIKASVYSVYLEDERKTLFDLFLEENKISFKSELKDIVSRLSVIGHKTGARDNFFKLNEGNPGDGVCALFDRPGSNLRLYCIRYGTLIIIVGGGGYKPKSIREFQQDQKLTEENYFLRELSKLIKTKMDDDEIEFSSDSMDFEGDLTFNDESDE
jgi:putative component of toxin-antitoxin plasmid stabilization module